MKRLGVFAVVLAAGGAAMVLFAAAYVFQSSQEGHYGWMMGQTGTGAGGSMPAMSGGAWAALGAILAVLFVGLGGLAYTLAYPEIRVTSGKPAQVRGTEVELGGSWEVLMKTSKEDERKVLGVLVAHGGSYLQKFVVKEAGLSKLKTHRIVSRLAERGVVNVERSGNTNQVSLAPWVRAEAAKQVQAGEAASVSHAT